MLSPILFSSFLLKTYTETSSLVKAEGGPGPRWQGKIMEKEQESASENGARFCVTWQRRRG